MQYDLEHILRSKTGPNTSRGAPMQKRYTFTEYAMFERNKNSPYQFSFLPLMLNLLFRFMMRNRRQDV